MKALLVVVITVISHTVPAPLTIAADTTIVARSHCQAFAANINQQTRIVAGDRSYHSFAYCIDLAAPTPRDSQ